MNCKHCGFAIGEDDHRCQRCGRRLTGVVIAAPAGYSGANALAMAPEAAPAANDTLDTQEFLRVRTNQQSAAVNQSDVPSQTPLFSGQTHKPEPLKANVIQFDQWQRQQPRTVPGQTRIAAIVPESPVPPGVAPR
jgi:hypothetical protein